MPLILSALLFASVAVVCSRLIMITVLSLCVVSFLVFSFAICSSVASREPRRRSPSFSFSGWGGGWKQVKKGRHVKILQKENTSEVCVLCQIMKFIVNNHFDRNSCNVQSKSVKSDFN